MTRVVGCAYLVASMLLVGLILVAGRVRHLARRPTDEPASGWRDWERVDSV